MSEQSFEARLERVLQDEAERGVRPIDAAAIARSAARGGRGRLAGLRTLAPAIVFALLGIGLAGGLALFAGSSPSASPAPSSQAAPSVSPEPSSQAAPSLPPSPIIPASVIADLNTLTSLSGSARTDALTRIAATYGAVPSVGQLQAEASVLAQVPAWVAAANPIDPGIMTTLMPTLVLDCTMATGTTASGRVSACGSAMRYAANAAWRTRAPAAIWFARGLVAYALAAQLEHPSPSYLDDLMLAFENS